MKNKTTLKVALVGNMNNNNFSLMRYLRDLGVDAHLFLFKEECSGSCAHFHPSCDSWNYEEYAKYVYKIKVGRLYPWCLRNPIKLNFKSSKQYLRNLLAPYNCIIGAGMTPSMIKYIGLRMDIFYPYSTGIEYFGNVGVRKLLKSKNKLKQLLCKIIVSKQGKAIQDARCCANVELGLTKQSFDSLNKKTAKLGFPVFYNGEVADKKLLQGPLKDSLSKMMNHELIVFTHARLMWKRDGESTKEDWILQSKNNDWLIRGFSDFIIESNSKSVLVIVEYGSDIKETRELCSELGIMENVLFLPKMSRKEIIVFLSYCDIGVGEFCSPETKVLGSTGWEVLACGKPLLQSFHYTESEYKNEFNQDPPPILDVQNRVDVKNHLVSLYHDKEARNNIGQDSKKWFDLHNGIELAKKWVHLLDNNYEI